LKIALLDMANLLLSGVRRRIRFRRRTGLP